MPEAIGRVGISVTLDCRLYAWVHAYEDEEQVGDYCVGQWGEMGILGRWCVGFGVRSGP